jgi:putative transposase
MKKSRFSEEKIVKILKEAEAGTRVEDLCRRYGMSDATFYTWRRKYGGLAPSELKRLRTLEEENRQLKKLVADQLLEITAIKDLLTKKF